ncbi:hypothetical protein POM88_031669 [Heracleum sosnowskyi]|uniref:X8 domain-containing protein n=1 Tax=Heracleum sosnowskyi TaxID=360622 RepID=A0AAD8HZ89_9APIA|nr:hypothetical protein POM88_031669 [Heracleum sosnowskyi]
MGSDNGTSSRKEGRVYILDSFKRSWKKSGGAWRSFGRWKKSWTFSKSSSSLPSWIVDVFLFKIVSVFEGGYLLGRHQKNCGPPAPAEQQRSWCVAKPDTPAELLQQNVNYVCNYVNCSIISEGAPVFFPEIKGATPPQ